MHYLFVPGMGPPEDRHLVFPYKTLACFLEHGSVVPDDGPTGNILSVTVSADESQ